MKRLALILMVALSLNAAEPCEPAPERETSAFEAALGGAILGALIMWHCTWVPFRDMHKRF